jgi:hypothetical protein
MQKEGPRIGRRNLAQGGCDGLHQRVTRAGGRLPQVGFDLREGSSIGE